MYSEESLKNYIFWLKFRRVFFMIIFSVVGCLAGMLASHFLIEILQLGDYLKIICIAVGVLVFFLLSLLCTAGTGKQIQEGYWKIAVLRKLTVISKKLDRIQVGESPDSKVVNEVTRDIQKSVAQVLEEVENLEDIVNVEDEGQKDKDRVPDEELKKVMESAKTETVKDEDTILEEIESIEVVEEDAGETKVVDVKEVNKQLEKDEKDSQEEKPVKKLKKKKTKEEEKPRIPTIRDEV